MSPQGVRGLERLLPVGCAIAAVMLLASEFTTTFVISEPVRGGICELMASDRHLYAFAVLAVFALIALATALYGASKPAATAVAACGVIALGLFLAIDLPDATASGTLGEGCSPVEGSFAEVTVDPQLGFWIQLAGALGLAVTGLALATFTSEQLGALVTRPTRRRDDEPGRRDRDDEPRGNAGDEPSAGQPSDNSHGGDAALRGGDDPARRDPGPGDSERSERRRGERRSASWRSGPR